MSPTLLNILAWSISGIWSTLVRESFLKRIFPDHMNLAMFTPVYKGIKTRYDKLRQYLFYEKIVEKLLLIRLTEFLDKNNIIYKHQSNCFSKKTN